MTLIGAVAAVTLNAQVPYTKTFSLDDVSPNATGWAYWFIPTGSVADTLDIKMSYVDKGEGTHGAHTHNHDELFIVVEGDAIVHVNGEERVLHPGDCMYCPSGSSHSIRRTDTTKPIRYVMFNRNTGGGIDTPYPFWKQDYTAADCFVIGKKNKTYWCLTPEQTLGGMNVRSVLLKGRKAQTYVADGQQLAILLLEGSADIAVDGKPVSLNAMSVCYVPKGSSCTVRAKGGPLRYLAAKSVR